ncbi:exported protein [Siccirubricoccus deserti]|uniref:Tripartite tricarboxylate transporter substrate binding protein n=1 Tax=Siccirubricoccus deserti TaxID=2013562 RepID=A0A9X0UF32_9PROT|nr:tripartite tricarboxylate transporter substrate binding protein [Siccirubricoccus deserti]MBC4017501.1 tripartite tricarboxylate transporter substrate binding protein [Siccirubricoccus deserti]GGC60150.1 exported protein [Siccirubricoccus deserti]
MIRRRALLASAALPFAAQARTSGGAWPDRPVRLVVPYTPGGANDILARLYGQRLAERLGQPFVVENRPGAQAILGAELVARAVPDGHTLLIGASGPIVFNPATYDRLPYDPLRDFAPVSLLAAFPLVLVVATGSPFRTMQDLLAFARDHPEQCSYGASATSFQLPTELLNQRAGTRFIHVAYRGSADTVNAVANDEVTMALVDTGPAAVAFQAGRVRVLAVTAAQRLPAWPDSPTMAELDYPDLTLRLWSGMLAPAGTPAAILEHLATEAAATGHEPMIRQKLQALSLDPVGLMPEAFRQVIKTELPLWAEVARKAGIRLER